VAQTVPAAGLTSKPKIVLVELFTSEGCSDCPPADELLRRIDRKQTSAGKLIVGVSEYVTYWNYLGWSDTKTFHAACVPVPSPDSTR